MMVFATLKELQKKKKKNLNILDMTKNSNRKCHSGARVEVFIVMKIQVVAFWVVTCVVMWWDTRVK